MPEDQPDVIIKSQRPFFTNPKFLGIAGIFILIFGILLFSKYFLISPSLKPGTTPQTKTLRGLLGVVQAVDTSKSTVMIKSAGKVASYPVSKDVLISQTVLGAKAEVGKQISLPTNLIYMEDLKSKKGLEVYLVFDTAGKNIIQIQIYQRTVQQ